MTSSLNVDSFSRRIAGGLSRPNHSGPPALLPHFSNLTPSPLRPVADPALEKNVASWQPWNRQGILSSSWDSPETYLTDTIVTVRGSYPICLTLRLKTPRHAQTLKNLSVPRCSSRTNKASRATAPLAKALLMKIHADFASSAQIPLNQLFTSFAMNACTHASVHHRLHPDKSSRLPQSVYP